MTKRKEDVALKEKQTEETKKELKLPEEVKALIAEELKKEKERILDEVRQEQKSASKKFQKQKTEKQKEREAYLNEEVEVHLFKDKNKYASDLFVSVNGKGYQIQRGKKVKVPRFVAEVIKNSKEQDEATAELIVSLSE